MTDQRRQTICRAIADLPNPCTVDEVRERLEPLLDSDDPLLSSASQDSGSISSSTITPLMMACDKAHKACIEYLMVQKCPMRRDVVGMPLDRLEDTLGSNTALHHAAMAGCSEAISMLILKDSDDDIYALGQATNTHGDTPHDGMCERTSSLSADVAGIGGRLRPSESNCWTAEPVGRLMFDTGLLPR
jgi:Ankyrin repeats (3 copies)